MKRFFYVSVALWIMFLSGMVDASVPDGRQAAERAEGQSCGA